MTFKVWVYSLALCLFSHPTFLGLFWATPRGGGKVLVWDCATFLSFLSMGFVLIFESGGGEFMLTFVLLDFSFRLTLPAFEDCFCSHCCFRFMLAA